MNTINLLIGGAAGDGVETTASLLEKTFKRSGVHVFGMRDFMSRIRGGHNFAQIRLGGAPIQAHRDTLDGIIALNRESYDLHKARLSPDGFVLGNPAEMVDAEYRLMPLELRELAKKAGNAKAVGSVAIGALLKLFGLRETAAEMVFRETLPPKILEANLQALHIGFAAVEPRTTLPATDLDKSILISASNAMALGALAANMKFYSAYPMSPATSIIEYLDAHSDALGVVAEQAEDEIAAINMALGASCAGVRSMTGTSGGGFSLMVEALGFAGIAEIPIVIANIQRPGPSTGLPTRTEQSDLSFVISASQGEFPRMVISIRDHADSYRQTVRAFALAEMYQIPVILLSDQYLADSVAVLPLSNVDQAPEFSGSVPENKADIGGEYRRYRLTDSGISPQGIPGKTGYPVRVDSDEHDAHGVITESAEVRTQMVDKRMRKLHHLEELTEPVFWGAEAFATLLMGFGSTYGVICETVELLNQRGEEQYAALCFGDVFPLPIGLLEKCAPQAVRLVNVEQNATGQLAALIRQATGILCSHSVLKYDGRQISVDELYARLVAFEEASA